MERFLFGLMAIAAGAAAAFQSAANAGLAERIGLGAALVVNTTIVLVAALALYLANGPHVGFFPRATPWWLYVGGVCGFVIVLSLAVVFPRIGAAVAIALMVLGQSAAALAIDHYGLFAMPISPVTAARIAGMVLVAGGVVLLRAG
jgi:bacterial/archaeal transporter family-2 protein